MHVASLVNGHLIVIEPEEVDRVAAAGERLAREAAIEVDHDALADVLDAGRGRHEVLHAKRQGLALVVLLGLLEAELLEHPLREEPRRPPREARDAFHELGVVEDQPHEVGVERGEVGGREQAQRLDLRLVDHGVALPLLHEDRREDEAAGLQHPTNHGRELRVELGEPCHLREVDGGGDEVGLVELVLLVVGHAARVVRLLDDRLVVLLIVGDRVVRVHAELPPRLEVS